MTQGNRAFMLAFFVFTPGFALAQTPGQIAKFDANGTTVVDSVVTEDAAGNIGIGTMTPAAALDLVGGNVNLEDSTETAGNILKGGVPFLHNFGTSNTFLGGNAGNLTMVGGYNTASGDSALFSNTTGNHNIATGVGALYSNTTGFNNTASGYNALWSDTGGSGNTATGFFALYNNTTADNNTANGDSALLSNTTGRHNTASGTQALFSNTTGSSNTAIGYGADVSVGNLSNATAIGADVIVDASNKIRLGNAQVSVIEGQVAFTFTSDKTRKENFKPVDGEGALGKIRGLNLTSWNYIGHDPKQLRHYGAMAQDFFDAFGDDGVGTIGTPTTINSGDMDGILMIAAQALEKRTVEQEKRATKQHEEINALRVENADVKARLETENADLKRRLAALERRVGNSALAKAE